MVVIDDGIVVDGPLLNLCFQNPALQTLLLVPLPLLLLDLLLLLLRFRLLPELDQAPLGLGPGWPPI